MKSQTKKQIEILAITGNKMDDDNNMKTKSKHMPVHSPHRDSSPVQIKGTRAELPNKSINQTQWANRILTEKRTFFIKMFLFFFFRFLSLSRQNQQLSLSTKANVVKMPRQLKKDPRNTIQTFRTEKTLTVKQYGNITVFFIRSTVFVSLATEK